MKIHQPLKICIILDSKLVNTASFELINWFQQNLNLTVKYILLPANRNIELSGRSFFLLFYLKITKAVWTAIKFIENFYYQKSYSDNAQHLIELTNENCLLNMSQHSDFQKTFEAFNAPDTDLSDIDLMVALTLNPYCEILKKFPRLGLISFSNFDSKKNPCNPIGFDEVFCQQGKTGFSIVRFLDEEGGADVLFRGAFPTHNYFLANHFNILRRRNYYIKKYIASILGGNYIENKTVERVHSLPMSTATPGLFKQIIYIYRLISKQITVLKNKILGKEVFWSVGFFHSDWTTFKMSDANIIENPKHCYLADPFVIRENNKNYCLAEEYSMKTSKGAIVAYELGNQTAKRIGYALNESFHMSFPYLFRYQEKIFMIPETSENNDIRIYESEEFPIKWKLNQVLMKDVFAVDSMIFEHDSKWWLFSNINPEGGPDACSELYIFSTSNPLSGQWDPHILNPVIVNSDKARNGGILFKDGKTYRVSQKQNFGMYGAEFAVNEIIALNDSEYLEKEVFQVKPDFFSNASATHHFHSNGNITAFDFLR